jgi:tetratricopeptide (TPR) repeat protein
VGRHDEGTSRARAVGWLLPAVLGVCWVCTAHAGAPPEGEAAEDQAVEPPAEPSAEPSTAREWYDHGIELGSAGDFSGAAAAFLRSYELQPTSEALYNAGFAYQQAGDPIAAIETYRRLLAEPARNEELARAAEASIVQLLREVGTLKGIIYAPGRPPAELYVAGEPRDPDELPILLMPGPVVIEVVDQQGERARETYEIAAGEALVVDLRALLPAIVEPPDEIDGPSPEQLDAERLRARREKQSKQLRIVTWVGLGLTGATGITVATFGGLTARERNAYLNATCLEYEDGDCPEGFEPGDPQAHFAAYTRYQLATRVSAGVTAGLAVGTLVVGLVSLRLKRKAAHARMSLRPSPGGFALSF